MGRKSHALIAATAGVIALIVAVVLVVFEFDSKPDAAASQSPAPTSEVSDTERPDPEDTPSSTADKPAPSTTSDGSDSGEPYQPSAPAGLPDPLSEAIPDDMKADDPNACDDRSTVQAVCWSTDGHQIIASVQGSDGSCQGVCEPIGQGDGSLAYAYIVLESSSGPAPFIQWASADYPDVQIRLYAKGLETDYELEDWWYAHLP